MALHEWIPVIPIHSQRTLSSSTSCVALQRETHIFTLFNKLGNQWLVQNEKPIVQTGINARQRDVLFPSELRELWEPYRSGVGFCLQTHHKTYCTRSSFCTSYGSFMSPGTAFQSTAVNVFDLFFPISDYGRKQYLQLQRHQKWRDLSYAFPYSQALFLPTYV